MKHEEQLIAGLQALGGEATLEQLVERLPDLTRGEISAAGRSLVTAGVASRKLDEGQVLYRLLARPRAATPATESRQAPPPASAKDFSQRTLSDRIRDILRHAAEPMSVSEVAEQLPDERQQSIANLLYQRTKAGEFVSIPLGRKRAYAVAGSTAIAVAVASAPPPAAEPAPAPSESPADQPPAPPPPSDPPRRAAPPAGVPAPSSIRELEKAVNAAENAREAYIQTVVDHSTWWWLNESVSSARAALAAVTGRPEG